MARLRDLAAGLGFEAPQTLLQSGNLVFRARASAEPIAVERLLETALACRLDLHADVSSARPPSGVASSSAIRFRARPNRIPVTCW